MAINNPYVPGDPFSYDLKWIIKKLKEHSLILSNLDEKIAAEVLAQLNVHSIVYFQNAAELIASDVKAPSLAYIEGFYAPGDLGANLYYVTDDYNDVLAADFYLTLNGANRWAIYIKTTSYVMPEMFGAVGDGTTDDTAAIITTFKFDNIIISNNHFITDSIPVHSEQNVLCYGEFNVDIPYADLTGTKKVFSDDSPVSNFTWNGGTINGTGVDDPHYLSLFYFEDGYNISIKNVNVFNAPYLFVFCFENCNYVDVDNVLVNHYSYGGVLFRNGTKNATVRNSKIFNLDVAGSGNGYPISLSGGITGAFVTSKNVSAINNEVDNSGTIARWEGIDAHGGENIRVIGNLIKGCIVGIACFNASDLAYDLNNMTIANNVIIGRADGPEGRGITAGGKNITITGNVIRNFTQSDRTAGLYIRICENVVASNNTIYNCKVGLLMSGNTSTVDVNNNVFTRCGHASDDAGQSPAIVLTDVQTATYIHHNTLHKCDGYFRVAGTLDGYTSITDNKLNSMTDSSCYYANNIISDMRTIAPSNLHMGELGDICRPATPTVGQPIGWICTSAWDGNSVTWTALANL